jgi:hypothetical protein
MNLAKLGYSKEDIKVLRSILPWRKLFSLVPPRSIINVRKTEYVTYENDLLNGVLGDSAAITWFLHYVPLEDVPLYIHDFPELARWRLMIAK